MNVRSHLAHTLILLSLTGCGTVAYHFDLAGSNSTYSETYTPPLSDQLSDSTGTTITVLSGNDNEAKMTGMGFRVGITEELNEFLVTRISYYSTDLGDITYKMNVQGLGDYTQTIAGKMSGIDISMGVNIWIFRPQYVVKTGKFAGKSVSTGVINTSESYTSDAKFTGFALAMEFDTGESSKIYLEYQSLAGEVLLYDSVTYGLDSIFLGFRLGGWGGGGKKTQRKLN